MKFKHPIITINELTEVLNNPRLVILDCSIDKIGKKLDELEVELIPNSLHFDIENQFSDLKSDLPHTLINEAKFSKEVQLLGINNDSIIVCYDRWGTYSSPRAWWMFKTMGFENVYVLNGGIKAWKKKNNLISKTYKTIESIGNFEAKINLKWIVYTSDVLKATENSNKKIIDARSSLRFNAQVEEPRHGLRKGHIKNSVNIPFEEILADDYIKNENELQIIFKDYSNYEETIFSCGSGITASILAIANHQINPNQASKVYDGSWSEWGKDHELPIE